MTLSVEHREKISAALRSPWRDGKKWCGHCRSFVEPAGFHRSAHSPDGLRNVCKVCRRHEKEAKPQLHRIYARRSYQRHREKRIAEAVAWAKANPERVCAKNRRLRSAWTNEQKEADRKSHREWAHRHSDRIWEYGRKRRARKGTEHFSNQEWLALVAHYGNRCLCCGATDARLEPDHVVPLVRGGADTIENIQPLCRPCNKRKWAHMIDYRPDAETIANKLKEQMMLAALANQKQQKGGKK